MKKAALLFETILAFAIATSIFILSSTLYLNISKSNQKEIEVALIKSDLFSTKLFIHKKLENSYLKSYTSNDIEFYLYDKSSFLQDLYSGYILLESSSKEFINTPKTTSNKNFKELIFPNGKIYTLLKNNKENRLYFENTLPKTIYSTYNIIKNISKIYYADNKLYYNANLLQDNVSKFEIRKNDKLIFINICIGKVCQEWIF